MVKACSAPPNSPFLQYLWQSRMVSFRHLAKHGAKLQHQRQEYLAFYMDFMSGGAGVISIRSICGYISFFFRDIPPFSMPYRRHDVWLVHTLSTSSSLSWPVSCTLMPLPYLRIGSNVPKEIFLTIYRKIRSYAKPCHDENDKKPLSIVSTRRDVLYMLREDSLLYIVNVFKPQITGPRGPHTRTLFFHLIIVTVV